MSSNRYSFSRKPYLVLEHIRFSRRPYLVLKHIQFSRRPLCLEHIGIFQEGTLSRTDISLIGLGGCFRRFHNKMAPQASQKSNKKTFGRHCHIVKLAGGSFFILLFSPLDPTVKKKKKRAGGYFN